MPPSSATIGCSAGRETMRATEHAMERMTTSGTGAAEAGAAFDRLLGELRPKLHRYCARMTGSVVDGEDVVQEALVKALEALPATPSIAHPEGWLFRIAHNAALDFLRRRARREASHSDQDPDMMIDPASAADHRQDAAESLRTFMGLPVSQPSRVIRMDVLGHALEEFGGGRDPRIRATRPALHAARRRLGGRPGDPTIVLRPCWRNPSARFLPRMWSVSMPAIS